MLLKVFCIYDSKAEAYLQPFFMMARGEAVRAFQTAVNDPQTNFCKHPSDYTLFEIGTFDQSSGNVAPYEAKVSLGLALEFKDKPADPAPLLAGIQGGQQ